MNSEIKLLGDAHICVMSSIKFERFRKVQTVNLDWHRVLIVTALF